MMLEKIGRWLFGARPISQKKVYHPEDDLFLDDLFLYNDKTSTNGAYYPGIDRGPKVFTACMIKDCERISAYSVLTTAKFDTDIVYSSELSRTSNLRAEPLFEYQQYELCDRHYREFVLSREDGDRIMVPMVLGPTDLKYKKVGTLGH